MASTKQPQLEFADGFSTFSKGVNSGIAPNLLDHETLAYATNCTVRGGFVKPRPGYRKQNLTLADSTIDMVTLFQGATYYLSDEGIGYLVALIGGRTYQFAPDTDRGATVFDRTIPNNPNPANVLQAWLWQSENYVITNDGLDRALIFDGIQTFRSDSPTFIGKTTQPFIIPAVGHEVELILDSDFKDEVGRYVQIVPFGLFPFLMKVTQISSNSIVAVNVDGGSSGAEVGATVPANAIVESILNPLYSGVTTTTFNPPRSGQVAIFSVSPAFNGSVGDVLVLGDGTGSIPAYELTVTQIGAGGFQLTVTNNLPSDGKSIVPIGFPVLSQKTQAAQLPIGRMGAYVQGRNWISLPDGKSFIATDLVGSSSGTQQFTFRDAVINWSQNTAKFPVPGGAGQINCIIALSALDASLGQGPLQVLCDNDVFTCSASTDATTWASTASPILSESIIGWGGVGQNAAVVANADLIVKSGDGTLHSLRLSRTDFNQWGNLPISTELTRVFQGENVTLFPYISNTLFQNRALSTCQPLNSAFGVYGQGIAVLDFYETSSLQGKGPSVYDGVWKDLNVLQFVSGKFNRIDRTFAFVANAVTNSVELWEIVPDLLYDDDGSGVPQPITWSFESPVIFNHIKEKGEFDLVRLIEGAVYFSDLVGEATIHVWYRPDFSNCWTYYDSAALVNPRPEPSYFMRAGLQEPSAGDFNDALNSTPAVDGRFFQFRVQITGSLIFKGAEFKACAQPENVPPQPLCKVPAPPVKQPDFVPPVTKRHLPPANVGTGLSPITDTPVLEVFNGATQLASGDTITTSN